MTTKILPQEFLFQENLNPIQVQTACAKELLEDKIFLPHVRHFKLAAGTVILVQVMNETKDRLLHEAEFRVTAAVKSLHGVSDDYGSKVREQTNYQVQRWSEWKSSGFIPVETPVPEREPESYVPGEAEIKWHPGKKAWDVMVDGEVWNSVERLEGESKEDFKARALSIAAGSQKAA